MAFAYLPSHMTKRLFLAGFSFCIAIGLWFSPARGSSRVVQTLNPTLSNSNMGALTAVELLSLDSVALQERLAAGLPSSVDLVKQCLQQIENDDRRGSRLNAMISIVPQQILMTRSKQLDQERAEGRVQSSLHGIPLLVKVSEMNRLKYNTLTLADAGRTLYTN
jgi:hypothetical protein